MKKIKYSEAELASVVVDYLESRDWDVYQEVQFRRYGAIADIVATKDSQMWTVETKISLGFPVLAQAEKWQCHYRSIAVLRSTRNNNHARKLAYRVCRNYLGIGIMEVLPSTHDVWVIVAPKLQDGIDSFVENNMKILHPLHKEYAKAGSKGSQHLTPYKYTMIQVKEFIGNNPDCSLNDIIVHVGKAHYASKHSAKQGIRKALSEWENWASYKWIGNQYGYRLKEISCD